MLMSALRSEGNPVGCMCFCAVAEPAAALKLGKWSLFCEGAMAVQSEQVMGRGHGWHVLPWRCCKGGSPKECNTYKELGTATAALMLSNPMACMHPGVRLRPGYTG